MIAKLKCFTYKSALTTTLLFKFQTRQSHSIPNCTFNRTNMTQLVRLRCSDVPQYLRDSAFYRSLDDTDDEEFTLLEKHFKTDTYVNCSTDVDHLLSTLRFWGSTPFPESIIDYMINRTYVLSADIVEEYSEYFPIINAIQSVRNCEIDQRMNKAIENESYVLVQYLHQRGGEFDETSSLLAAKVGSVPILKFICEHGHLPNRDATKAAAEKGHLHCLQYLHSIGCRWHRDVGLSAASNGHTQCLRFVLETGHEPASWVGLRKLAARNGHYECLQYLLPMNALTSEDHIVHCAADSGSVRCLQVAYNFTHEWPSGIQHTIIHNQNLDCFIYSITHGCRYAAVSICSIAKLGLLSHLEYIHTHTALSFTEFTMQSAITNGKIDCVKFLHICGCAWSTTATAVAIRRNDYDCLVYLHQHGAVLSVSDCTTAASHGHLQCLQYLHTHKASWDTETCRAAAKHGHLACLIYLHENGCPWEIGTTMEALHNNHKECYAYAKKHGCPLPPVTTQMSKWLGL